MRIRPRVPVLTFKHPNGCVVDLTINKQSSVIVSHVLRYYASADDRVAPLCLFLRKWAKEANVHGAKSGGLPSVALNHMAVFYLQHSRPRVLPRLPKRTIQELQNNIPRLSWNSKNNKTLAQLYRSMMTYFARFDFHRKAMSITAYRTMRDSLDGDETSSMQYGMVVMHAVSETNLATSTIDEHNHNKILEAFRREARLVRNLQDIYAE